MKICSPSSDSSLCVLTSKLRPLLWYQSEVAWSDGHDNPLFLEGAKAKTTTDPGTNLEGADIGPYKIFRMSRTVLTDQTRRSRGWCRGTNIGHHRQIVQFRLPLPYISEPNNWFIPSFSPHFPTTCLCYPHSHGHCPYICPYIHSCIL